MRTFLFASIMMSSLFLVGNVMESHAGEAYLKIEARDKSISGPGKYGLKLLSYEWGGGHLVSEGSSKGGALPATRPDFKNLVISMYIDKSFPKMAVASAKGQFFKTVTLTEIHPQTKQPILTILLNDATASSISLGSVETEAPTVSVEFAYGRIEWTYHDIDQRTGKPKGSVKGYWDLRANKGG
jgi:type VI protein secretion system component Hcp